VFAQLVDTPQASARKSAMSIVTQVFDARLNAVAHPGTPENDALQIGATSKFVQPRRAKSAADCHCRVKPAGAPVGPAQTLTDVEPAVAPAHVNCSVESLP